MSIGTGGVTGVYYPVGGAIAKMVKIHAPNLRASVESTAGSVYNINAVLTGDLQFGIAQSDRQYQAINYTAEWGQSKAGGKLDTGKLRSVFSLHREAMTFVLAADKSIESIEGLKNNPDLVINIGARGTGTRNNAIEVLGALGIDVQKDFKAEAIQPAESSNLIQDKRIDGFLYTLGHPSGAITESTNGARKVRFIPVKNTQLIVEKFPYYAPTRIPIKFYPQALNKEDVPTVGLLATLVTSAEVPEEVVYYLVKTVFENFDQFKSIHPSLEFLDKESMLKGLSAPLHLGARRYYKENGLLP